MQPIFYWWSPWLCIDELAWRLRVWLLCGHSLHNMLEVVPTWWSITCRSICWLSVWPLDVWKQPLALIGLFHIHLFSLMSTQPLEGCLHTHLAHFSLYLALIPMRLREWDFWQGAWLMYFYKLDLVASTLEYFDSFALCSLLPPKNTWTWVSLPTLCVFQGQLMSWEPTCHLGSKLLRLDHNS